MTQGRVERAPLRNGAVSAWSRGGAPTASCSMRNPYYRPRPQLRRVVFSLIPTTQASLFALRAGDVDVTEIDPAQIPEARNVSRRARRADAHQRRVLSDAADDGGRDRRSARAARDRRRVDRREIVRGRYGALAAADSFLPPVFAWHDSAPQTIGGDPAAVARELQFAGWHREGGRWTKNGRPLRIDDRDRARARHVDAGDRTGATAPRRHRCVDQTLCRGACSTPRTARCEAASFSVAAAQWIGASDPEQSVIFACGQRGPSGNNSMNYCNPRFDALFEDQAVTRDAARRGSDFIEMQRIIRRDAPVVPIAFESRRRRRRQSRERLSPQYADVSGRPGDLGRAVSDPSTRALRARLRMTPNARCARGSG